MKKALVRFHTEKYDKSVSFDINQGDIIIPFDDGDIVLSPPVLRWKFGDGEFSMHYGEDLWYKNYSNSAELAIDLPTEMGYQVFLNNTVLTEGTSFNSFKLGETIWSMLQDGQAELIALVKIDDVGIIPILTVCLKEKLRFSPLVVSGKDLLWDASKSFIGDSTPKFRVSFYEKLGFSFNDFYYLQQPLNPGDSPFRLNIMSYPESIGEKEFEKYKKDIYRDVYGVEI